MGWITRGKRAIGRATGIPTTASGRRRKFGWGWPSRSRGGDGGDDLSCGEAALGCVVCLVGLPVLCFCVCGGLVHFFGPPPPKPPEPESPAAVAARLDLQAARERVRQATVRAKELNDRPDPAPPVLAGLDDVQVACSKDSPLHAYVTREDVAGGKPAAFAYETTVYVKVLDDPETTPAACRVRFAFGQHKGKDGWVKVDRLGPEGAEKVREYARQLPAHRQAREELRRSRAEAEEEKQKAEAAVREIESAQE